MADRVPDDARIWVAREWADEQIRTIPLGSKAEVQEWLDGQLDDVDGRPVVITAKEYRANVLAGAEEHVENLLRYAVARFVDESPAQDGPPSDWQQQLSEVASFGRFETVARLVDGWRQRPAYDTALDGLAIVSDGTPEGQAVALADTLRQTMQERDTLRAAYSFLAEAVRKDNRYPLGNELQVAEYAIKHGAQVIDRRRTGKCPGCGYGPPEEGYMTCWTCVVRAEEARRG